MRLNKFIARMTGMGRRPADILVHDGKVQVNGQPAMLGQEVHEGDIITLDGKQFTVTETGDTATTIMLNKPAGYVVSRNGQGSRTIYDLLPPEYQQLKPIGRLDKYSSGLLLLTNDGQLANELTHPSRQKLKMYDVTLDKPLAPLHRQMVSDHGIMLEDGVSSFELEQVVDGNDTRWKVVMHEGRNRQIRRTFKALGYNVTKLHRTQFGPYQLGQLSPGKVRPASNS